MELNVTMVTSEAARTTISKNIRRLRAKRGLSAKECAYRIGISARAFSDIEHGRAEPRTSTLMNIASCLGVSIDALCGVNK